MVCPNVWSNSMKIYWLNQLMLLLPIVKLSTVKNVQVEFVNCINTVKGNIPPTESAKIHHHHLGGRDAEIQRFHPAIIILSWCVCLLYCHK
jgi:hypothetical protein